MFSRIKKSVILALTLLVLSCSNIIHDVIPPDEDEILSFQVYSNGNNVTKSSTISKKQVDITVSEDAEIANLLPVVSYSEKSSGIPFTVSYLHKAFPSANVHKVAMDMYEARKQNRLMDWCVEFIQSNPDFIVPELNLTIDFSTDVQFGVIAGDGSFKTYTIKVAQEASYQEGNDEENESSSEKDIIEFKVDGQIGSSTIETNEIGFSIPQDSDETSIIPQITVSDGASVLPVTMEYLLEYMDMTKLVSFYSGFSSASNTEKFLASAIKKYGIDFPETLTKPIDFSDAVYFIVKADDGSIKLYKAICTKKNSVPALQKVTFTKISNAGLVKDCPATASTNTFEAQTIYPVDYKQDGGDLSLIADIIYEGDKVTYKLNEDDAEQEFISGETSIPLTGSQRSFMLIVYLNGTSVTYTVNAIYAEDPDTIRSITDFRFLKSINSDINATAMAAICNEGDTGLITATVLYSGAKPEILVPSFISPGTVTIEHKKQISGITSQDFTQELQYLCTSKNGMYCRLYTVRVEFIFVERAEASIRSFTFPALLNKNLSCDAVGIVNDSTNTIFVEALYHSSSIPYDLIPQFSATGKTTVSGITQSSGYTEQNFSHAVRYTVQSAEDASVTKTYKVQVSFKFDDSCACSLDTFEFEQSKNATLGSDVSATVSQNSMTVFALLPYGTDSKNTKLIPTFTANGTVTINGTTQISGASEVDFSNPVTYTVTSANGTYTKEYTITLAESGEIIYVDSAAIGRNNGTSWQDAFISMDTALEAAGTLPQATTVEMWVADRDEYVIGNDPTWNDIGWRINYNLILRGGFNGNETSITQREDEKKTKLTRMDFSYYVEEFAGSIFLEDLEVSSCFITDKATTSNYEKIGKSSIEISNCKLNGSYIIGKKVKITNSESTAACNMYSSEAEIKDSNFDIFLSTLTLSDENSIANVEISNTNINGTLRTDTCQDVKISNGCKIQKYHTTGRVDEIGTKLIVKDSEITSLDIEAPIRELHAELSSIGIDRNFSCCGNEEDDEYIFTFTDCALKGGILFTEYNRDRNTPKVITCTINNCTLEGEGFQWREGLRAQSLIGFGFEIRYGIKKFYLTIKDSVFTASGDIDYGIWGARARTTTTEIDNLTLTNATGEFYNAIDTTGNVSIKDSNFSNFSNVGVNISSYSTLEIDNLTLSNATGNYNTAIETQANTSIKNCHFSNFSKSGVSVIPLIGDSVIVENNTFEPTQGGTDLVIINDTNANCDIGRIKGNTFAKWGYVGLSGSSERTYADNTVLEGYMTETNGEKKSVGLKLYGNSSTSITDKDFISLGVFGGSARLNNCRIWKNAENSTYDENAPLLVSKNASVTASDCRIGESAKDDGNIAVINTGSLIIASSTINGGIGDGTNSNASSEIDFQATDCIINGYVKNMHKDGNLLDTCNLIGANGYAKWFGGKMSDCTFEGKFNSTPRISESYGTFDGNVFSPESGSTLNACTFSQASTIKKMEFDGFKGAIETKNGASVIENCKFKNCTYNYAILGSSSLNVINSEFANCIGGISYANSISGCTFTDISTKTAADEVHKVESCTFTRCTKSSIDTWHNLEIKDSTFTDSGSLTCGSSYSNLGSDANLKITGNTTFTNCGGIISYAKESVITDARFKNCKEISFYNNDGKATVTDCTFEDSSDTTFYAIYTKSNLTINGGSFTNCKEIYSKAKETSISSANLLNTTISIDEDGETASLTNCTFKNCKNINFKNKNGTATVTDCTFENCNAPNNGGAIYSDASKNVISGTKFKDCHTNTEKGYGGAICFLSLAENATLTDCTFENCNTAEGGAIYSCANLTINGGTSFTRCAANEGGGAISFFGTELDISGASFSLCSAGNATTMGWGGAIYIIKGNSKINNCTFNTNGCTMNGGAIKCDAKTCEIISCTFSGNKCVQSGAGIDICPPEDGSQYAVRNCNFQNNQAGINGGNYKGNDITCSWSTIVGTNIRVDHTATLTLSGNSAADIYTTDKITRN